MLYVRWVYLLESNHFRLRLYCEDKNLESSYRQVYLARDFGLQTSTQVFSVLFSFTRQINSLVFILVLSSTDEAKVIFSKRNIPQLCKLVLQSLKVRATCVVYLFIRINSKQKMLEYYYVDMKRYNLCKSSLAVSCISYFTFTFIYIVGTKQFLR